MFIENILTFFLRITCCSFNYQNLILGKMTLIRFAMKNVKNFDCFQDKMHLNSWLNAKSGILEESKNLQC